MKIVNIIDDSIENEIKKIFVLEVSKNRYVDIVGIFNDEVYLYVMELKNNNIIYDYSGNIYENNIIVENDLIKFVDEYIANSSWLQIQTYNNFEKCIIIDFLINNNIITKEFNTDINMFLNSYTSIEATQIYERYHEFIIKETIQK